MMLVDAAGGYSVGTTVSTAGGGSWSNSLTRNVNAATKRRWARDRMLPPVCHHGMCGPSSSSLQLGVVCAKLATLRVATPGREQVSGLLRLLLRCTDGGRHRFMNIVDLRSKSH